MRFRSWMLASTALLVGACGGQGSRPETSPSPTPARIVRGPLAGIQQMLDAGDVDGAIGRLDAVDENAGPERLYLLGEAWALKAETAPLPPPEPPPPGSPRGAAPVIPEFKSEEKTALSFFEKATAAMPYDSRPYMGLANLLAPHARRHHEAAIAAAKKPTPHGRHAERLPAPPPPNPEVSPARVIKAYRTAAASAKDAAALEALFSFAMAVEQLDDADWALKEMISRDRENPAPLVRYGDFLAGAKKMPEAALAEYRQALLWSPGDKSINAKIADVYIGQGAEHFQQTDWARAEVDYNNALKYVERGSEQAKRIQQELDRLADVRRQ